MKSKKINKVWSKIDDVLNALIRNKGISMLSFISGFLIIFFRNTLTETILPALAGSKPHSSPLLCFAISVIAIFLIILGIRMYRNRYKYSAFQLYGLALIWFTYLSLRFSIEGVKFDSIHFGSYFKLAYIDLIILATLSFLFPFVLQCIDFFERDKKQNKLDKTINYFLEDSPVLLENIQDNGLSRLVSKLYTTISSDYYRKAFAIGIIAQWGSGKSSFLKTFKQKLKDSDDGKTIEIDFEPFLNLKSDDIVREFFTLLSNRLAPFNGRLAEKIEDYSDKLARLYKRGEVKNLFANTAVFDNSKSAKELYDNIDDAIRMLDKRIIIYIDDVDRLQPKEILSVLQLIRNTANFANTIFIVALDKNYVVKSLESEKVPESDKYVEKFFQLEVHLPIIESAKLKSEFLRLIDAIADTDLPPTQKRAIRVALSDDDSMFDKYVRNYRGVKRYFNQFIYEESLLRGEVEVIDLLKFIFLKNRFPKFVQYLCEHQHDLLFMANNIVKLRKNGDPKDGFGFNVTQFMSNAKITDEERRKNNLLVLEDLFNPDLENCKAKSLNVKCEEHDLIIETMKSLFQDNTPISAISIRRTAIFAKIVRMRFGFEEISEDEFANFLEIVPLLDLNIFISNLKENNRLDYFLDRLNYHEPTSFVHFQKVIVLYVTLYDNYEKFQIPSNYILPALGRIIHFGLFAEQSKKYKTDLQLFLKKNIFHGKFSLSTRAALIYELWTEKEHNLLWGFNKNEIYDWGISYVDQFVAMYNDCDLDQYFFRIFHDLKYITNDKDESLIVYLNEKILNLLRTSSNSLISFCRWILENDGSSSTYRLSDILDEIFGSKKEFHEFIFTQKFESDGLLEFQRLSTLFSIVNYSYSLKFAFSYFKPRAVEYHVSNKNRIANLELESSRILQIFMKFTGYDELVRKDKKISDFLQSGHFRWFLGDAENTKYLYVVKHLSDEEKYFFIRDLYNLIKENYSFYFLKTEGMTGAFEIIENQWQIHYDGQEIFSVLSCEPLLNGVKITK